MDDDGRGDALGFVVPFDFWQDGVERGDGETGVGIAGDWHAVAGFLAVGDVAFVPGGAFCVFGAFVTRGDAGSGGGTDFGADAALFP